MPLPSTSVACDMVRKSTVQPPVNRLSASRRRRRSIHGEQSRKTDGRTRERTNEQTYGVSQVSSAAGTYLCLRRRRLCRRLRRPRFFARRLVAAAAAVAGGRHAICCCENMIVPMCFRVFLVVCVCMAICTYSCEHIYMSI